MVAAAVVVIVAAEAEAVDSERSLPAGGGGNMMMMGGPAGGDARKPYQLTVGINVTNLFNTVNFSNPVSSLSSPSFGQYRSTGGGFGFFGGGGGGSANRACRPVIEVQLLRDGRKFDTIEGGSGKFRPFFLFLEKRFIIAYRNMKSLPFMIDSSARSSFRLHFGQTPPASADVKAAGKAAATRLRSELAKAALAAHGGDKFKKVTTLVMKGGVDLNVSNQIMTGAFSAALSGSKYFFEISTAAPVLQAGIRRAADLLQPYGNYACLR